MENYPEEPPVLNVNKEEPASWHQPVEKDHRTWATMCHVAGFVGSLIFFIPLLNIAAPLVIWILKKDEHPFVSHHGKEAINFQINLTIWGWIVFFLTFILIGYVFMFFLVIYWIVVTIIAIVKANDGKLYRIPFIFRFVR